MHSDHTCACVPVAAALHVCPRVKTGTQVCACVCVPEHVSARMCAQWLDGVPAPGLQPRPAWNRFAGIPRG